MSNNEKLNKHKECNCKHNGPDTYKVSSEEEKAKIDPTKPCDETNPDYPWVSCGIDKKPKNDEKK